MKLSLESLQLLVAAADSGSFSAAARGLGKAQSAVSMAIANLEIDLGLTLFDRSGRLPLLTLAGERMVAEARALLAQQGQLQAVAAELAAGVEARLTLAIDDGSLLPWLAPVLEQLAARYPSLELELLFPMMEDLDEMLLSGRAQLGVGYQGMTTPAALARFGLGQMAMPLVVAPGHPLAQMAAPALADLGRYRQLLVTGRQPGVEPSSMARVSRASTPAASSAATACSCPCCASKARASATIRSPARVSSGRRPLRSNRVSPKSISRLAIAMLTADCALPSPRAAAEKEPLSAAATSSCRLSNDSFIYLVS
jgi:DNA-binding transcriptional LysR family regulator